MFLYVTGQHSQQRICLVPVTLVRVAVARGGLTACHTLQHEPSDAIFSWPPPHMYTYVYISICKCWAGHLNSHLKQAWVFQTREQCIEPVRFPSANFVVFFFKIADDRDPSLGTVLATGGVLEIAATSGHCLSTNEKRKWRQRRIKGVGCHAVRPLIPCFFRKRTSKTETMPLLLLLRFFLIDAPLEVGV